VTQMVSLVVSDACLCVE